MLLSAAETLVSMYSNEISVAEVYVAAGDSEPASKLLLVIILAEMPIYSVLKVPAALILPSRT